MEQSMLTQDQMRQFNQDGYLIVENFWPEELIQFWENTLILFYLRQSNKIGAIKNKLNVTLQNQHLSVLDFDNILLLLETEYKEAAYQVLNMVSNSCAGHKMLSFDELINAASQLINCPPMLLTPSCIHPFINLPSTKRLLYKWHAESCYYPKRRNFLNIWFPLFRDKRIDNGTMWVCKKSHDVPERHFVEYQGYDRESENKKNHFIQYEIPEVELSEYEKIPLIVKRRDIVFFHRALAHTSTFNQSDLPSYASVIRIFDYGNDLTLSGDPAVQCYKDSGGISQLLPVNSAVFFSEVDCGN